MAKDENEQAVQETEENQDPQEPEEMADSEAEVNQPDNTATTVSVDEASGDSNEEPNSTALWPTWPWPTTTATTSRSC